LIFPFEFAIALR